LPEFLSLYTSICNLQRLYLRDRSPLSCFIYIYIYTCVRIFEHCSRQRHLMALYMIEYQTLCTFPRRSSAYITVPHNVWNLSQNHYYYYYFYYYSLTLLSEFRQYLTKPSHGEHNITATLRSTYEVYSSCSFLQSYRTLQLISVTNRSPPPPNFSSY
jgi:hypothetical protein